MLVDEVIIKIEAGDGGKGAVAFNKNVLSLGPSGARGGDGGSIYFEGVSDLGALRQFQHKKDIKAENGENGKEQFNDGTAGTDLVLKVPLGTVIQKIETGETVEVLKIGERIRAAKGGHGGKGNYLFRSSTNTSPTQFQEGLPGERFTVRLELKLIADVGIIGLPNAGKSSLLNELTKAKSKVANYSFTTLEPHLGSYYGLILADIPGLIEGASEGKGLGTKFLRHIERTRVLFHLISAESDDLARDYLTIRNELKMFNEKLIEKQEYVFLSKSDIAPAAEVKKKIAILKKVCKKVLPISVNDWDSLEKVKKILNEMQEEK